MVTNQIPGLTSVLFIFLLITRYASADAAPVTADVDHGFFETPFTVTLSTETPGATIRYTLDCSDPRESPDAQTGPAPVSILIDPQNTTGRTATPAVVLRAVAVTPADGPGPLLTKTYIFIDQVVTQTYPGEPWPDIPPPEPEPDTTIVITDSTTDTIITQPPWTFFNGQIYDYDMDSAIVQDARYQGLIDDALLSIPSVSLVSDMDSLFNDSLGLYDNALNSGREWERPGSVELINTDGSQGFSVHCGIRIRGGWSRHPDCPKHSFRLYFRSEYGAAKLEYPLFEDEGVSSFDKISLRTSQNYSWSYKDEEGAHNTMVKDVFCRDSQRDLGQHYTRSRYYHLYLNGMYWGLYQTQEHADNRYAESYMGGDYLDYDVLNTVNDYEMRSDRDKTVEVSDGTIEAAQRLWTKTLAGFSTAADYYSVQGLEADGRTPSPQSERLLDVDNLIDYLMITLYTGNFDSPTYAFSEPQRTNNFQAIYNRVAPDGFKWMSHDGEHTMVDFQINPRDSLISAIDIDRTGPFDLPDDIRFFNPQRIHQELCANGDYRIRFADHVFRHFFNNGVFCPGPVKSRYRNRAKEIETAIIAESARWGDSKRDTARTKDDDWLPELDRIYNEYIPERTAIVIEQFRGDSLYPSIEPPVFAAGEIITAAKIAGAAGYQLTMQNPGVSGEIIYSVDGNDPRLPGGSVYSNATSSTDPAVIPIATTTHVKARIKTADEWSALRELLVTVPQDFSGLMISEIHYKPLETETDPGSAFEFIELKNTGDAAINLTGVRFSTGIEYQFEPGTSIDAGDFVVIASDRFKFAERYGFIPDGEYTSQLSNSGELIEIQDANGTPLISFTYNDAAPWPLEPDQSGKSLIPVQANEMPDPNDGANWTSSAVVHGSPGKDDRNSIGAHITNTGFSPARNISCRVGRFRFRLPFGNDFRVSILNLQGKVIAAFPEKGKTAYQWNPQSNGLFLIMFRSVSGEQLVKRVQVVD